MDNTALKNASYPVCCRLFGNEKLKFRGFSPQANYIDRANLCGYRVSLGQRNKSPTAVNLDFLDPEPLFFHLKLLSYPHQAEWTPFQTHYFSENLVVPGIELGTSGCVARNSDQ
jgi:hypothetical protein